MGMSVNRVIQGRELRLHRVPNTLSNLWKVLPTRRLMKHVRLRRLERQPLRGPTYATLLWMTLTRRVHVSAAEAALRLSIGMSARACAQGRASSPVSAATFPESRWRPHSYLRRIASRKSLWNATRGGASVLALTGAFGSSLSAPEATDAFALVRMTCVHPDDTAGEPR